MVLLDVNGTTSIWQSQLEFARKNAMYNYAKHMHSKASLGPVSIAVHCISSMNDSAVKTDSFWRDLYTNNKFQGDVVMNSVNQVA